MQTTTPQTTTHVLSETDLPPLRGLTLMWEDIPEPAYRRAGEAKPGRSGSGGGGGGGGVRE